MKERSDGMEIASTDLLAEQWVLGYRDRGHGYGDFAVVTTSNRPVVEAPNRAIAEHIVQLHNTANVKVEAPK